MSDAAALPAAPPHLPPRAFVPGEVAGEGAASLRALHALLDDLLPAGPVAIYEAGGGSTSYLPAALTRRARITVVDIDPDQVARNTYADESLLGDIQTRRFAAGRFDLVVCYNVIEHVPDVAAVVERFAECVRPGGLVLVGAPHPASLSGWVTRRTPHWFHVLYYRWVRGDRRAGLPGEAPFPVHYHPLVEPAALQAFAAAHGFEPVYLRLYESPRYAELRQRWPGPARLVDAATDLVNRLVGGNVRHGDYHLLLRKAGPGAGAARHAAL